MRKFTCADSANDANCALTNKGGICQQGPITDTSYTTGENTAATGETVSTPLNLGVPIPGVSFAQSVQGVGENLIFPFIAQYIAGIERYLIAISFIAAGIMTVYGGFLYMSATQKGMSMGKTIIRDALIGLVLLLSAVLILQTINPATVTPEALKVKYIEKKDFFSNKSPTSFKADGMPVSTASKPNPSGDTATVPVPPPDRPPVNSTAVPSAKKAPVKDGKPPPLPSEPGNFELPPVPGGIGKLHNGNCDFDINQGGLPTVLSIYKCAFEVVAKEVGIDPCYFVGPLTIETPMARTDIVGHDEWPLRKQLTPGGSSSDLAPVYKSFLNSGRTYKGKTFPPLGSNPDLYKNPGNDVVNDDIIDYSQPNLGLDQEGHGGRWTHGYGVGFTVVPQGCTITDFNDLRKRIQPYYALLQAAQWIKCAQDRQVKLYEIHNIQDAQRYNGIIYNVFSDWGGHYANPNHPELDYYSPLTMQYISPNTHAGLVSRCLRLKDPYKAIYQGLAPDVPIAGTSHFSHCTGDLPLKHDECIAYVNTYLKVFGVNANISCNQVCFSSNAIFNVINKPNSQDLVPRQHYCLQDNQCDTGQSCRGAAPWIAGVCMK